jgi:hypothetical protein
MQLWLDIPRQIELSLDALPEEALDFRGGAEDWSIREYVHHIVEANLVAATIVIAALADNRCVYDWSWVNPDADWMRNLRYDRAPIAPALELLKVLGRHIATLVDAAPGGRARQALLLDAPGEKPYSVTIENVLLQESEHARQHLADVMHIRATRG